MPTKYRPNPEKAATYIIDKNGADVYATNGHTGEQPFRGIDAAAVIQAAANAGKDIYLKEATYNIATHIIPSDGLTIRGARSSILKATAPLDAVILTTDKVGVTIKDFTIDGNKAINDARGIQGFGNNTAKTIIDNMYLYNCYPNYIAQQSGDIRATNNYLFDTLNSTGDVVGIIVGTIGDQYVLGVRSKNIIVSGNRLFNIYGDGIAIDHTQAIVNKNFVDKNGRGLGSGWGINVFGACDASQVTDNIVIGARNGATLSGGISVNRYAYAGPNYTYTNGLLLSDNIIKACGSSGIYVGGGGDAAKPRNISIKDNIISGTFTGDYASGGDISLYYCRDMTVLDNELYSTPSIFIDTIEGVNKIRNNKGFVTENWVTGVGTGAQQLVAHGLAATPTRVILSELDTGLAIPYQSAAADVTNIKVTAVLNKTWAAYVAVY